MARRGKLRIGTSGYQYKHWRGLFYPEKLPQKKWFEFYAERFDTVEINNTFYGLPREASFDQWRQKAPKGFCYALKYSRYGTHRKRLRDPRQHIETFMERALRLEEFLGPILVQLPPNWACDAGRLDEFLAEGPRGQRWAVEFRDESWLNEEVYDLLLRHKAALVIHDKFVHPQVVTAKWVYLRYHGGSEDGNYTRGQLAEEAGKIRQWLDDALDVYAYFNNDARGYAIANALDLLKMFNE